MKLRRFAIVALSLGLLIATSNTLSGTVSRQKFSESYPSVVCPATLSGLSSQVSLGSRETRIKRVGSTSSKFFSSRALRIPVPGDPILVDAQGNVFKRARGEVAMDDLTDMINQMIGV